MEKESIKINDWLRILFGEVPPSFYLEVIIRVVFLYLLLIFSIRLMGKKTAARLTRGEMAAIVSMAAAIGVSIQAPDRGLLPPIIISIVVVVINLFVARKYTKNEKFEQKTQGSLHTLVDDCCLRLKEMQMTRLSKERLFAQLRSDSIVHLGEVKRFYFEANGSFSLIRNNPSVPGLPILFEDDEAFFKTKQLSKEVEVCENCGKRRENKQITCDNCNHEKFTRAMC